MSSKYLISAIFILCNFSASSQKIKINTDASYFIKVANATPVAAHELIIDNHFKFIKQVDETSEMKGYRLYALGNIVPDNETILIYKFSERGSLSVNFPLDGMDAQRKKMLPYKIASRFDEAGNLEITYKCLGQKMRLTEGGETATLIIYP